MKQITINLYEFGELSESAKEKAKSLFYEDWDGWRDERLDSFNAARKLYKLFDTELPVSGVRLFKLIQNRIMPELKQRFKYRKDASGNIEIYPSNGIREHEKARFSNIQYNYEAGNLTGYCSDYDFLQPIFDFIGKPHESIANKNITSHSLRDTDLECIWERIVDDEFDDYFEDSNFAGHCEANEYFFAEDGKLHK